MPRLTFLLPLLLAPAGDNTVAKDGPYSVKTAVRFVGKERAAITVHVLLIGDMVNFGTNFVKPDDKKAHGDPAKDYSRWATTYYHRQGPAGVMLEKFNWFPDAEGNNTFTADARLPASLVGGGVPVLGVGLPVDQLAAAWSEPPVGVVRLNTGTLASYARPYQCLDFYDADGKTLAFCEPAKGEPLFHYIPDAKKRGARIRVLVGDERKTLAEKAPKRFYHALFVEVTRTDIMVINKDLLTQQALASYMDTLAEQGVLCIHISHRTHNFAPVIADGAKKLGLACVVVYDQAPGAMLRQPGDVEHYSSNWVLVARKQAYLASLRQPADYRALLARAKADNAGPARPDDPFFAPVEATGRHLWTDGGENSLEGLAFKR
jgi:hypothetical protein